MNFWQKLPKPFLVLAPMEGVTDTVFRQIVARDGKPDAFFTEFVPVDGLLSKGKTEVFKFLQFSPLERPIVAQIWGIDPEKFYKSAKIIKDLGFDGIDINMGCPVRNVTQRGACSALIKSPKLAKEIILATIKGAGNLPVSVKTRIGFGEIDTENWVRTLLQTPIAALTLHLRTAKELFKVKAHWDELKKAIKIREELGSQTLIIGNGDVKSKKEALEKCSKYGIDGVMIGRGVFENIYVFNENIDIEKVTPEQKIKLLLKHLNLFKKTWGPKRHFALMKKFVKCYVNNFPGASDLRVSLMETKDLDELITETKILIKKNLDSHPTSTLK